MHRIVTVRLLPLTAAAFLFYLSSGVSWAKPALPPRAFILDFSFNSDDSEELARDLTNIFQAQLSTLNQERSCFTLLERRKADELEEIQRSEARRLSKSLEEMRKERPLPTGALAFRGRVDKRSNLRVFVSLTNIWQGDILIDRFIELPDDPDSDTRKVKIKELAEKFCPKKPRSIWRDPRFVKSLGGFAGGGAAAFYGANAMNEAGDELRGLPRITRAEQIEYNQRRDDVKHDYEIGQVLRNVGGATAGASLVLAVLRYRRYSRESDLLHATSLSSVEHYWSWQVVGDFRRPAIAVKITF